MDLELTEEQVELADLMREVAQAECPASLVRAVAEHSEGDLVEGLWATLVGLDWPALTVPTEAGGMGSGPVELVLMAEELGRVADPSPLLATASQYSAVVRECFADPQRSELLGEVCRGVTGAVCFDNADVQVRRDGPRWALSGRLRHVIDGDRADRLAVVANIDGAIDVFVLDARALAAKGAFSATRIDSYDATLHIADVDLDAAEPIAHVGGGDVSNGDDIAGGVELARSEAVVCLAASSVGASQRVFDMTLGHIKDRYQFGQPIGAFQAVKHMAADVFVAIERARVLCHYAAFALADRDGGGDTGTSMATREAERTARTSLAASLAKSAAGDCQRIAVNHGIQLFGGLGYTWENDIHLFVRRAKSAEPLLGSSAHHRQVATASYQPVPGYVFDDESEAFRRELVDWLAVNMPAPETTSVRTHSSADIPPWAREWQAKMFDAGWLVPGNSPEFGGRDATLIQQLVHREEFARHGIYASFNPQGLGIIVPSILAFGTEDQKRRWAVPILRAEITAALGMSEPDAGSDLAGLRTRAVLEDGRFIVNGQKVWTSGAHDADVILAFVRTDLEASKHRGISALLIPTDSPGLTRRPFGSIMSPEELDFNEVFFDDVEVPAENLIGELNSGWTVATGSLGHERAMLWLDYAERLERQLGNAMVRFAGRDELGDPVVADRLGSFVADAYALRLLGQRSLVEASKGFEPAAQSILKLFGSEAVQRQSLEIVELLGSDGLDQTVACGPQSHLSLDSDSEAWINRYLRSFSGTIAGGTSQIQRNIIAERILGLPR